MPLLFDSQWNLASPNHLVIKMLSGYILALYEQPNLSDLMKLINLSNVLIKCL